MTLNAKGAIGRFRASLKRVYYNYNAKLQGVPGNKALTIVHNQANALEIMALSPLAYHLAELFHTSNDLPYVTYVTNGLASLMQRSGY